MWLPTGLLTILSESIANTNTNIWFKKYCQYQYQYFFHKVLAIPIPILSNQYKYTNIINIVLLHLLITKSSNWVCKCPLKYCRYSYYCSLLAEYSLVFKTQKFAQRKNSIISKCSLLSLARRGENTLPPNENSLSTAALAGRPVFSVINSFRMFG